ncbi:type II toxin-antitoxin system PemK/MazF family toxin [Microcoleus vaginatus]|uniref:type II toxin-antitoxin system PemK/MazF family toxin n=1 Tax=Microcoleus vaginatus TaxID=119532 RepID=UPI001F6136DA|nr:type II toxin-antitoxin system PemK/MazF family toxin [Microcoleus vaginatus HSN003]
MTNYQSGELVLVGFIFAGAAETKRRPGLVLLDTGDEDMIVAKITSQITRTNFDVEIQEWQQAGLKRPSVVRLHKVNTLQKSLVERRLGILTPDDLAQVRNRVKQIWSFP